MEQSFARIDDLISARFSEGHVSKDVSNVFISDSPSHVQIQQPLGKGRPDPSQSNPHQDYGKSGGEPEESVRAESAMSPDFLSWVDGLHSAGVCIPQPVLDLDRLDSVSQGGVAEAAILVSSGA